MTIFELDNLIRKYHNAGFRKQIKAAISRARGETREYIERTHPQVAFGGKSLIVDDYNRNTHHQTVLGSFNFNGSVSAATIYANYFQRWYNTGTRQHMMKYGKYRGRQSTEYYPRGHYYAYNKRNIESYYLERLNLALDEFIKI